MHSHKIVPHGASWHAGKSVVVRAQSKDTDFDSILTTLADKVWYIVSQGCRFMACQPVDPHGCLTSMSLGQHRQLHSHDRVSCCVCSLRRLTRSLLSLAGQLQL